MDNAQLKTFVGGLLTLGEFLAGLGDGFSFDDIRKAVEVAKVMNPMLQNAKPALDQYRAMSDEQAKELEDYIAAEFDIEDDKLELVIESVLRFAIELRGLADILLPKPA